MRFCDMPFFAEISSDLLQRCRLRSLDLSWTAFPIGQDVRFAHAVQHATALEKLVLHATQMTSGAAAALVGALHQAHCSRLTLLDLSNNDALDAPSVASIIATDRLTSLNLGSVVDVGLNTGVIANALLRQTSLRTLDLFKCNITNVGMESLAEALLFNQRIEQLTIGHVPLNDAGATSRFYQSFVFRFSDFRLPEKRFVWC
jgi:Ran GTPase-activating protein (RanGAP) involved in mRNA processing and transport